MAKPKKQKKKILALLDVHAILHRAYHALPDFASSRGEPTGALYGLCTMLLKLVKDVHPDYVVACYDLPEPTKRHELYEAYKAGRQKTDEALILQLERSKDVFTAFNIPMYSSPGFEADDMLGTIVEQMKDTDMDIVIASGDMDTLQLVSGESVKVYTLKKGIKDTIIYDEAAVKERFGFGPDLLPDYKGLRGDPSDNIVGIHGIGEKSAAELIQTFGSIEEMYGQIDKDEAVFDKKAEKAGIKKRIIDLLKAGKEEALFSKMLATIRRDGPIHFALPEKPLAESVDMEKVEKLFAEFEFKTLGAKVAEAFSLDLPAGDREENENGSGEDNDLLYETGLLLWIVDSNKTNPDKGDILSFTRTRTVSEAKVVLEKMIADQGLSFVAEKIEKPLVPIIKEMKHYGVKIDTDLLSDLSRRYHAELETIQKKIWKEAGQEFNVSSPKQLGEVLFVKMGLKPKNQKKTSSGGLSTKESELEKLRDVHPIASLVLEYRELSKLLGTYIDTIPDQVDSGGRLHGDFLQMGSTTGRMASTNPNLQNIPNKTDLGREIRKAFITEKNCRLLSFDYSQIELRIAAFLSGDKKMIDIFKKGQDVHTAVAAEVFKVPTEEVSKEMRRRAKIINFGIIYGMGVLALKQNLGTSKEEAERFMVDYFSTFADLAEYLENVKRETATRGYTETFFGRRRYFPDIRSKLPFMRAAAERMAINAPIQGTEADIVKLAMIEIDNFLKKEKLSEKVHLLLQVHDELVYEVEKDLVDDLTPKIKAIMEDIIDPTKTHGVICVANASVGENWAEMKEIG